MVIKDCPNVTHDRETPLIVTITKGYMLRFNLFHLLLKLSNRTEPDRFKVFSTVFLTNLDRLRHRTVPSPSPYRTPTVTVPSPYRTLPYPTVPHRTPPYLTVPTVFKFFKAKKRKKRWVRWGTMRYGGGTVR
jgi:hypothetical protein